MKNLSLFILIGNTGSGKTRILRNLKSPFVQILDLEHIADNSGSAFGRHTNKNPSLSQSEFRYKLLLQLSLLKPNVPVVSEWKGNKLGALKIPDFLYSKLITAPKIVIQRSEKARIEELKKAYGKLSMEDLYKSLFSLRSNFTENNFQCALLALQDKNKTKFIQSMLQYYDCSPEYNINQTNIAYKISWDSQLIDEICQEIEVFFREYIDPK